MVPLQVFVMGIWLELDRVVLCMYHFHLAAIVPISSARPCGRFDL